MHRVPVRQCMRDDHSYKQRKYRKIQTTRQLSCPAKIEIKEIVSFPDYKTISLFCEYKVLFFPLYNERYSKKNSFRINTDRFMMGFKPTCRWRLAGSVKTGGPTQRLGPACYAVGGGSLTLPSSSGLIVLLVLNSTAVAMPVSSLDYARL